MSLVNSGSIFAFSTLKSRNLTDSALSGKRKGGERMSENHWKNWPREGSYLECVVVVGLTRRLDVDEVP